MKYFQSDHRFFGEKNDGIPNMLSLKGVESARKNISPHILNTPILRSAYLSQRLEADVFLKLDLFQGSGSFKDRGALNALLNLSDPEKKQGVVAASAGNHGQALALHANRLGIKSHIFMPIETPSLKVSRCEKFGGIVHLQGANYQEAFLAAQAFIEKSGGTYIHAYDNWRVIEGQATMALECLESHAPFDHAFIPTGGGGLLGGMAFVFAEKGQKTLFHGVEPASYPAMKAAFEANKPVSIPFEPNIAEGLSVNQVGEKSFFLCKNRVHSLLGVSDDQIARAMALLVEEEKLVSEGAGASCVAALLSFNPSELKGKRILLALTGGNVDPTLLSRVIHYGMIKTERMSRLSVIVRDRPGALLELLEMVRNARANIIQIKHARGFAHVGFQEVKVELTLFIRGREHLSDIVKSMRKGGYEVEVLFGAK